MHIDLEAKNTIAALARDVHISFQYDVFNNAFVVITQWFHYDLSRTAFDNRIECGL